MRSMKFVPPLLTLALIVFAVPALSQVAPTYEAHGLPFALGVGPSSFDPNFGQGRMFGVTAWGDWYPGRLPAILYGLGLEGEGRDIHFGRNLPSQKNVRQDTIGVGPIYTWRHFSNFQPYGKFIIGYGSFDFTSPSPTYNHDTRALYAYGGGAEYRFFGPLWARADYEYETVQPLIFITHHPQGLTFGVSYNFRPQIR
jgi:opacity protein-like surface antigen